MAGLPRSWLNSVRRLPPLKTPPPRLTSRREEDGKKEVIDCQHKHENDITKTLLLLTGAKDVPIDDRDAVLANEYQREVLEREQTKRAKLAKRASKREEARLEAGVTA